MTNKAETWLLEGPAWVAYRAWIDLIGKPEDEPGVTAARQTMLDDPQLQTVIAELQSWPGAPLKRHNDAAHLLHTLTFAADLGLRATDPGIAHVLQQIFEHQSPEGPFQVLVNIPVRFGGSGNDEHAWMLCDTPLVTYALIKLGQGEDPRVQRAIAYLVELVRNNGWPCAATSLLGKFHGPGNKADPCPYATLIMLKALALLPDYRDHRAAHIGVEALLSLWEKRKERRPYLFAMGTHFKRLKAPLIWYDLLHMLDVLTQYPWALDDPRLHEMATILRGKADAQGYFTPESIWMAWKDWEFGQKRTPSRWLTLISLRILKRLGIN